MIKKASLFISILIFVSFTLVNNFRELVIEKLENYRNNYPEKIYIQTDKPYYALGDDIWYSAYLVNGISHKASNTSNVVYVELINSKDSIVSKKQLCVTDLSVAGDFKLRKRWEPGNYTLRAYSNYMRNKEQDYFFQTNIPVLDTSKKNLTFNGDTSKNFEISKNSIKSNLEIGFYPEGGYLVDNIPSKIAIKVKGKNFKDDDVLEGVIKDSDNEIITTFKTYKFGLGLIKFTPETNKSYFASIIIKDDEVKYPLPKTLPSGYNLEISNNGKQIIVQLSSNTTLGLKNTFLLAHQRGNLIYENLQTQDTTSQRIRIDTKFLQDGVSNFTLFDSTGKPVCERLVYIDNPEDDVDVNISLDKSTPATRDKVTMKINLTDNINSPQYGNLSMSVTDINAINHDTKDENIKTYLLLNSDLRGKIEDPGYFFQKKGDYKRRYLLDLVMLTHGWRRFKWEELLYNTPNKNPKFKPEKGLYISGITTALKGSRKQISAATRLTIMQKNMHQESMQTDANGRFRYGPYIFNDTIKAMLEARVKDFNSDHEKLNRFVDIGLNDQLKNSPPINKSIYNYIFNNIKDSTKLINYLEQTELKLKIDTEFSKTRTKLDEIVITAKNTSKEEEERNKEIREKTLYGNPNQRLDLSKNEDQRIYNVMDLINQLPTVVAFDDNISIRNQGQANILLDGQNVQVEDILFLTGDDVDFIDVLDGPRAAIFPNSANGVIAIYSRTGSFSSNQNVKRSPGITNFSVAGFYSTREFYAPNYSDEFENFSNYQDIRTTLHWEPKIVLNQASTEAEVSFYTSDVKSRYAIKIEGITHTGIPVYHLSTIEVD